MSLPPALFRPNPGSPSPSLPDEGYDEQQRADIPNCILHYTEDQRAELAVRLLKSVSPSVFSRTYTLLMPLFEYRDFLVLLPYELTVHLLSFLDASTLSKVAMVSKAWNKCAADNTVWKGLYRRQGWTVNQDMMDWYLRSFKVADAWMRELETKFYTDQVERRPSVILGKQKMPDYDIYDVAEKSEDFEMLQAPTDDHSEDEHQECGGASPFGQPNDTLMANSAKDNFDVGSSPISIPSSSPINSDSLTSPEPSPLFAPPSHSQTWSSARSPPARQRQGRFSIANTAFMPSIHRTRLPMYTLGSNLMTPPSMFKKISQRATPPAPIRIPGFPSASTSSRSSRFFNNQRSEPAEQRHSESQPTSPTLSALDASPIAGSSSNAPSGPHSPSTTKSLWSVLRHGVMGVSGSSVWPSLHNHRHHHSSESGEAEHGPSSSSTTPHQSHSLSPSLPSWLMSPLTGPSSRNHRSAATAATTTTSPLTSPRASTLTSPTTFGTPMTRSTFQEKPFPVIPKRINFQDPNAPHPSEVLPAHVLEKHQDSRMRQPMINWKFLYQQRKHLEQNWNKGHYEARELPGHMEGIYCIQFDDHKIVSGSRDNTIKIWDFATGVCLRTYSGHTASVLCLQFDETFIVSGSSDMTIIVWDLESGRAVQRLVGHGDSVLSLRFEKDVVVSCSKDRTVKIWRISTGELIRTLVGHRAAVNAVQFSPEGSRSPLPGLADRVVVSASGDRMIKIWSMETGECLKTLEGHTRGIACIQFEGNVIVSGSSDCSIKIWDVAEGVCTRTLTGHDGLVRTLQFSLRGNRILSGGYDATLKVWDMEKGVLLADLRGRHLHRVFKLQFNESKIVSCSQDQKIIIWDLAKDVDTSFLM